MTGKDKEEEKCEGRSRTEDKEEEKSNGESRIKDQEGGNQESCRKETEDRKESNKTEKEEIHTDSFGIVGLHCCGDLTPSILKLFQSNSKASHLVCVGCCYYGMQWKDHQCLNYPLSIFFRENGASTNATALKVPFSFDFFFPFSHCFVPFFYLFVSFVVIMECNGKKTNVSITFYEIFLKKMERRQMQLP